MALESLGKNYQSLILFVAGGVVVLLLLWTVLHNSVISGLFSPATGAKVVYLGGVPIAVDIAATLAARERGLSGRAALAAGQGMLFLFDNDGDWGFWMKNMNFPIDIIWADSSGRVVTVLPSVSPDTYPKIFYPSLPARYVLEVPAGFSAQNNVYEGEQMTFGTSTPH